MPPKKEKSDKASKSKETNEPIETNEPAEPTEAPKRAPSAYNVFMKTELPKVKAENPGIAHKEAFKVAAGRWKDSEDNPKNKTG